jgi:cytochrome c-type biogenesis protein CcmH/NrfG
MTNTKCPSCQSPLGSGAKFCPECGASLTGATAAAPSANTRIRDLSVVVGVLVVMSVAYFIFRDKPTQPQTAEQPRPASGQEAMPPDHPPVEGMSTMPGMAMLDSLPQDFNSLVAFGNQNMDQGQLPVAAESYRRALALDSSQVDVRVDYGACLHGMGVDNRAIEEFHKALRSSPRHSIAHFNLGIVYLDLQQKDSAIVYFKKYLEIEPNGRAAADASRILKEIGG